MKTTVQTKAESYYCSTKRSIYCKGNKTKEAHMGETRNSSENFKGGDT
jgi:hypothetical protein